MLDKVPILGTFGFNAMRVISRKTLKDFWEKHADAEQPLKAWFHEMRVAHWKSCTDIKAHYRSADVLPGNRIVFNIKGSTYRLVVHLHYNTGIVFVRFVGTHAAYDKIDATTI
jgi:mRNA interferase HigB